MPLETHKVELISRSASGLNYLYYCFSEGKYFEVSNNQNAADEYIRQVLYGNYIVRNWFEIGGRQGKSSEASERRSMNIWKYTIVYDYKANQPAEKLNVCTCDSMLLQYGCPSARGKKCINRQFER